MILAALPTTPGDYWDDIAISIQRDWVTAIPLVIVCLVVAVIVAALVWVFVFGLRFLLKGKDVSILGAKVKDENYNGPERRDSGQDHPELCRRLESLETRQTETEHLSRLILRVLDHQTAAQKATLEALKGTCNGNVDAAITRLDKAETETKEFLFQGVTTGREEA